jgi:translation initiation factor IF-3
MPATRSTSGSSRAAHTPPSGKFAAAPLKPSTRAAVKADDEEALDDDELAGAAHAAAADAEAMLNGGGTGAMGGRALTTAEIEHELAEMDPARADELLRTLTPKAARGEARDGVVKRDHVRLIDGRGRFLGAFALADAETMARKAGTRLRLFSPEPVTYVLESNQARPPRNGEIKHRTVTVIDEKGKNAGEQSIEAARAKAAELKLDVILVKESPPTVRLADWGKFQFEQRKSKKAQSGGSRLKQVRFGAFSEEHDIDNKFKQVVGFLESGKQVRVSVVFKRARDYDQESALSTLEYLKTQLAAHGSPADTAPSIVGGKSASLTLSPKKTGGAPKKAADAAAAAATAAASAAAAKSKK